MSDIRRANRPSSRVLRKSESRRGVAAGRLACEPLEERTLLSAMRVSAVPFGAIEGHAVVGVLVATFTGGTSGASSLATIAWGDGTTSGGTVSADPKVAGQFDVTASKPGGYAEEGSPTVGVTVSGGGNSATAFWAASVVDAPLSVSAQPIASAVGQPLVNVLAATFTDADPGALASDFAGTVSWGDGTVSAGTVAADPNVAGQFDVTASKPAGYATQGTEALTVTISDGRGAGAVGSWTSVAPLPAARGRLAVAEGADGRVYAIGGLDATNNVSAEVDAYSPTTNAWTTVASLPTPRQLLAGATGPDGRIYAVGGLDPSYNPVAEVDAYNPATNTWTTVSPLPSARSAVGLVSGFDGRLYAVGGRDAGNTPVTEVDAYEPVANIWSVVAGLPSARASVAVAAGPGGLLYAIGGAGFSGQSGEVDAYNPATNTWSVGPALPNARTTIGAATGADGRIYAVGGYASPTGYTSEVDAFDPATGAWTQAAPLPIPRSGVGVALGTDSRLYAVGGTYPNNAPSSEVDAASTLARASVTSSAPVTIAGDTLTVSIPPLAPTEGQPLANVPVATFTDSNPGATAAGLTATVSWGDGTVSAGTVAVDPNVAGQFDVTASKPAGYMEEGKLTLGVTVTRGSNLGAAHTWTTVASMLTALTHMAVATGGDGRLYAFGGDDLSNIPSAVVYAFNPTTNSWTDVIAMPYARHQIAATAGPDGRIYVVGGLDSSNNYVAEVDVYDPVANTWSLAAPLPTARAAVGLTTGLDGRIYAIGGRTSSASASTEVDAFNPATGTWTTLASLPNARAFVATTTGPAGRIYAIGGAGASSLSAEVDGYDPSTGAWTVLASLPNPRAGQGAATGPDGRIYAVGGYGPPNGDNVEVDTYDPSTGAWTFAAALPVGRDGVATVTGTDGRIYAIGGGTPNVTAEVDAFLAADRSSATASATVTVADAALHLVALPTSAVEGQPLTGALVATFTDADPGALASDFASTITWGDGTTSAGTVAADPNVAGQFDVTASKPAGYAQEGTSTLTVSVTDGGVGTSSAWATAASLPSPRTHLAVVTGGDGRVYAIGGTDASNQPSAEVDAFNTTTGTWTTVASLPIARTALAAAAGPDGRIYAIGGYDPAKGPTAEVDVFDPASNTWSVVASLPTPRAALAATAGADGRIYALGGYGPSNVASAEVDAFNPASGTWTTVASLPDARSYLAATTGPLGRIYALGGLDASYNFSKEAAAYDPTAGTWTEVATLPNGRAGLAATTGLDGHIYAIGGYAPATGPGVEVDVFDPTAGTWSAGVSLPIGRDGIKAATGPDGRIYVIGGGPSGASVEVDSFAPGNASPAVATGSASVTAADPAVSATGGYTLSATPGVAFAGQTVATFADPGGSEVIGNYSASINWGDGQSSAGTIAFDSGTGLFTVVGGHTYAAAGPEVVTVTIGHESAPVATVTDAANVGAISVATSTALGSSSNPASFGVPVTLTATVAPLSTGAPAPTGTVTFLDGATTLGTATLSNGVATLTTAGLAVGSHNLSASYGGDAFHQASLSSTLAEAIRKATPTLALASSAGSPVFGQTVTFTATLNAPGAGIPTGTVTFLDGARSLGTVALSNGVATLTTAALAVGSHPIRVSYGGDANFQAAGPVTRTQAVGKDGTTITLGLSATTTTYGQSVTLTASLADIAPGVGPLTGTVTFFDGATALGTVAVSGGAATLTTAALGAGSHALTASYSGDADDQGGVSASATLAVQQPATTLTLASTSANPVSGQAITFTATVAPVAPGSGTPTGVVTFADRGVTLGTATLVNGVATLAPGGLSAGTQAVSATYGGDANFRAGAYASITEQVSQAATTTTLATSASPAVYGQSLTFTATVVVNAPGGGVPTGSVNFYNGGTYLGSPFVNASGKATFTIAFLAPGTYSITASYPGDSNNFGSTSPALVQAINPAATTTTLDTSVTPTAFGQAVKFTATLTTNAPGVGTPAGIVTFFDGATALGTVAATYGVATLTTSTLAAGGHSITAVYSGNAYDLGSTSAPLSQAVQVPATTTVLQPLMTETYGQYVYLTASVSGVGPLTGTVTFFDGATDLGAFYLTNGVATTPIYGLNAGTHSITAAYSGDANDGASTSAAVPLVILPYATTTTLTTSATPSVVGQAVTFSATILGYTTQNGTVTFLDNGVPIGTATPSSSVATLTTTALGLGSHAISATFGGDTNDVGSTSPTLVQVVNPDATFTTVSTNGTLQTYGQSVTLTAAVSVYAPGSVTPTGTITFLDGTKALATVPLSGPFATLNISTLAAGGHQITASYSGDANDLASASPPLAQAIQPVATSVGLNASPSPDYHGQVLTLTATVVGPPPGIPLRGSVTFLDGSTPLGTVAVNDLTGGIARLTTSALTTGDHAFVATYSGDANDLTSDSAQLFKTVFPNLVNVRGSSSIPHPVLGQPVTFTATVSLATPGSGAPTGTLTLNDGPTAIGTATLINGVARFTTSALSVGPNAISFTYPGDANDLGNISPVTSLVILPDNTNLTLTSSATTSTYGQPVTLTATTTVIAPSSGTPTGLVTFKDGSNVLGTAPLVNGIATLTTATLAVGNHALTASYGGDANFAPKASPGLTQAVTRAGTTATLAMPVNIPTFGQPATFTATILPVAPGAGTPIGTVTFKDGGILLGTAALINGVATLTTSTLASGSHPITAAYLGGANFLPVTSPVANQAVNSASTAVMLSSSASPATLGRSVTLTATVAVVAPGSGTTSGTVTFLDGSTILGTATINRGVATLTTSALTVGTHALTASYAGNPNIQGNVSPTLAEVVQQATTTLLSSSANPSLPGQPVTLKATVAPVAPGVGTPTGTVTFMDGSTALATVALSNGAATVVTSMLSQGNHAIVAVYGGDAANHGSTSMALTQGVRAVTTVSLSSSMPTSSLGSTVTFSADLGTVAPGIGVPTGTVTFLDGATTLGTVTLVDGIATFSTSLLASGSHSIKAVYGGDLGHRVQTSAALNQKVL